MIPSKSEALRLSGVNERGLNEVNEALPIYIFAAMDLWSKEVAIGFYHFTEWKPENNDWFNENGEIKDLNEVYNQYIQTLQP